MPKVYNFSVDQSSTEEFNFLYKQSGTLVDLSKYSISMIIAPSYDTKKVYLTLNLVNDPALTGLYINGLGSVKVRINKSDIDELNFNKAIYAVFISNPNINYQKSILQGTITYNRGIKY